MAAGFILSSAKAPAQDALRSALAIEPIIGSQQPTPAELLPDRPHLGPVLLETAAYAGLELNDNVNSSESDPRADLLLRGGLNLGLAWPVTTESNLHFRSNLGYVHYLRNSQYDHLEVAPNSALSWAIGWPNGSVSLFDQFSYSQQVLAEPAISGLAIFPRFNNTIGAQANWLPGQCAFEIGYSHNNAFSDSSQFNYLNSSSEYFFSRAGWRFGEISQAGLEVSSGLTSYELQSQNNNYSLSLGPYSDWQITHWLHASIRGGGVFYVFDSRPASSQGKQLNAYYFGFELDHHLTDFLTHKITVQRDVRQGLNQGSSYLEELTANYSASFSLSSKISLGAGFTFEQGTQPLEVLVNVFPFGTLGIPSTENYTRYGTTLSASWQATERLAASVTYSHWMRDSSLAGLGYKVNSIAFNLSFTF